MAPTSTVTNPGGAVLQQKANHRYSTYAAVDLDKPEEKESTRTKLVQSGQAQRPNKSTTAVKSRSKSQSSGSSEPNDQKDVHPRNRVYKPIVTSRYPEVDWRDAITFPASLPTFCFPAHFSFKFSDEKPPTTYHSFVMTDENLGRTYAICVTFYERPSAHMHQQLDIICQRWTRSHMTETEIEFARSIKEKIARERQHLASLKLQFREEKTAGRRGRQEDLRCEIMDSEEKLCLFLGQMEDWKNKFVEADDAWIPRSIGLVSAIPYHYLMRDWLLSMVAICAGGIEHAGISQPSLRLESYVKNLIEEVPLPPLGKLETPIIINNRTIYASRPALNSVPIVKNVILSEGKVVFVSSYPGMLTLACESFLYLLFPLYWYGVYIPILPSDAMTCLQAPVPYIIGVERSCRDSEFPPEEACIVDLDEGIIKVQLAPAQLPPRPRRKLIQSLEQYAPTSAIRRPAPPHIPLGPPDYVKEAFPHSRLTLFCGVSRAPRGGKRVESPRPTGSPTSGHSAVVQQNGYSNGTTRDPTLPPPMIITTNGTDGGRGRTSVDHTRHGSQQQQQQQQQQPLSYSKVAGGMARSMSESHFLKDQDDLNNGTLYKDTFSRSESMREASPMTQHIKESRNSSESIKSTSRKILSQSRNRSSVFEKKQENGSTPTAVPVHPGINRQNSCHSTHMSGYDGPGLRHRASFTSIDSSSSSLLSKSPVSVSTITSTTMASINGHSPPSTVHNMGLDDDVPYSNGPGETEKIPPITIEGHVLAVLSTPLHSSLLSYRCGICTGNLSLTTVVHRCEGCSLYVHAGCLDELLYPCVPRGFDESAVCWSVLQMWAGLLKGYRSCIVGSGIQSTSSQQQFQQQLQHFPQLNGSYRYGGHAKQPSNCGSEFEREGHRMSWVSRLTGKGGGGGGGGSGGSGGANGNGHSKTFSAGNRASTNVEQLHHQHHHGGLPQRTQLSSHSHTMPRSRNGTGSSAQSDSATFQREVFLKGVDKEAKPFMSMFTESPAFVQFIQERVERSPGDPEIMFFDEVIKTKMNRSRFRLGKEETKFLHDSSYGVQGTLAAIPPKGEPQSYDNNDPRRFPTKLDPAYL
ncbi:hypothetical protein BGX31_010888 [Mortierella sp. GBA43]|nr:hypothetical protein BGX31_010888 [Mortierella sp. GBA43]